MHSLLPQAVHASFHLLPLIPPFCNITLLLNWLHDQQKVLLVNCHKLITLPLINNNNYYTEIHAMELLLLRRICVQ